MNELLASFGGGGEKRGKEEEGKDLRGQIGCGKWAMERRMGKQGGMWRRGEGEGGWGDREKEEGGKRRTKSKLYTVCKCSLVIL